MKQKEINKIKEEAIDVIEDCKHSILVENWKQVEKYLELLEKIIKLETL